EERQRPGDHRASPLFIAGGAIHLFPGLLPGPLGGTLLVEGVLHLIHGLVDLFADGLAGTFRVAFAIAAVENQGGCRNKRGKDTVNADHWVVPLQRRYHSDPERWRRFRRCSGIARQAASAESTALSRASGSTGLARTPSAPRLRA